MSWKATAAVKHLTYDGHGQILTAREKLLLFVLADYHNDERNAAWAGLVALSKASLTSRKHTITLLQRLEDRGLIAIEKRPQKTNLYRLLFVGDTTVRSKVKKEPASRVQAGGSEATSPSVGEVGSPGVVTSRCDQGSHLASSPEPSPSLQDSKAAPDRPSQDTRSRAASTVQRGRQFHDDLKKLSREKAFPFPMRPADPLRSDLYGGIHWKRIENALFDSKHRAFEGQLIAAVEVATTDLVLNRTGKVMVLQATDIEKLAVERLFRGLETLRAVADFTRRVRLSRDAIGNAVISAAAELLEGKEVEVPA